MDDLISRQAAIEAVRNMWGIVSPISDDVLLIDKAQAETELMMLPTAEPRKGKWISEIDTAEEMLKCSVCEARVIKAHYEKAVGTEGFKHCPYCGARMEQ